MTDLWRSGAFGFSLVLEKFERQPGLCTTKIVLLVPSGNTATCDVTATAP
jgi:hypothetical protein